MNWRRRASAISAVAQRRGEALQGGVVGGRPADRARPAGRRRCRRRAVRLSVERSWLASSGAVLREIGEQGGLLVAGQGRNAAAHQLTLHALHGDLPHRGGQAAGRVEAMAAGAARGVEAGARRVGLGQAGVTAGGDQRERAQGDQPAAAHAVSPRAGRWRAGRSSPRPTTSIASSGPTPSASSSRRSSPARYCASSSTEVWTIGSSSTSARGKRNSSCS